MTISSNKIKEAMEILKELPTIALNNQMLNIAKMQKKEELQIFLEHLDANETIIFWYLIQCSYTEGVSDGLDISEHLNKSIRRVVK